MSGARNRVIAVLVGLAALTAPATAQAEIGIESFETRVENSVGDLETRAAAHPDAIEVNFQLTRKADNYASGVPKDIRTSLPAGFIGNPQALPQCTRAEFLNTINPDIRQGCRPEAQVGVIKVIVYQFGMDQVNAFALYNIEPEKNEIADFGFILAGVPVHLVPQIRSDGDYGIDVSSLSTTSGVPIVGAEVTFWGYPMDAKHTPLRVCNAAVQVPGAGPEAECPSSAPRQAFLTNPSVCGDPLSTVMTVDSWQEPGNFKSAVSTTPTGLTGCDELLFEPTVEAASNTRSAEAPLGMTVDLTVPQADNPDGRATPTLKKAVITFPRGVAIAPPSADGLEGCSDADLKLGSSAEPTCPFASKIGSLSLNTPVLPDPLSGDVILRTPKPGELFRLALVIDGPGFVIKLDGQAVPDPDTGQLRVTFDDNPQLPFSSLHVELNAGPRAPLVTPPACGTYTTRSELTSWAMPDEAVESESTFTIDRNCEAAARFTPSLRAGTINPLAGKHSPFVLRVTREDGQQNVSRIDAALPPGLLAKLAGVPLCGDAAAGAGACPASSQIGTTTVGIGAGPSPLFVPQAGKAPTGVYLAGSYKGAPYSLVVVVPAQAGPFDLGTVAVRSGIYVDPVTSAVSVKSDPLPQILQGIPIAYRDIRVEIDRPGFTLNPTSCEPMSVTSTIVSIAGAVASPADRFQVAGCERLGFKPKLSLKLSGPTRRTAHPALRAVLKMPRGNANIGKAVVTLPETEFLENAHIRTICTRVQYAAESCPKASVYGYARAWTPLLDEPLQGPVYLRSSNHKLPDLVADLNGQIEIDLAGRIDSPKGRIRNTFWAVPDAPVSKFVLTMQGGKKGLLVNNTELCKAKPRAKAEFTGQNGKRSVSSPLVKTSCGKR
ncbi:MAG TPA: hypothetical protein VFZ29_10680 [Solirubrobacterales bacterium]